jgi:uncharacterized protein YjaZ
MANVYMARMSSLVPVEVHKVKTTYHNDRTASQAAKVKETLIEEGLTEERILTVGFRDDEPPVAFPADQERLVVVKFISADK